MGLSDDRLSYSRSTATMNLSVRVKKTLQSYGLLTARDFERNGQLFSVADLQKGERSRAVQVLLMDSQRQAVIRLPAADCAAVMEAVSKSSSSHACDSLYDVLVHETKGNHFQKISTSCPALDRLLTGGVQVGSLTEVHGEAGCGKTQFCLQLCVNVQLPQSLDGQEGEAVFVDCENGFSSERLLQMASAVVERWLGAEATADQFLRRIHLFKCKTIEQLDSCLLNQMQKHLSLHPEVSKDDMDRMA